MPLEFVLASASPRRRELLAALYANFDVAASGFDESSIAGGRPEALARRLAAAKAREVAAARPDAVVLAADTIVVYRGTMLGKPEDASQAREMLRKLRGRLHRVVTGVAVAAPGRVRPRVRHLVSQVRMRAYSDADIEDSIGREVPFDKAGGYGIQDPVLRPVQACDGCFCNVMGLPLWTAAVMLTEAGIAVDASGMPERCGSCPDRPGLSESESSRDLGILRS